MGLPSWTCVSWSAGTTLAAKHLLNVPTFFLWQTPAPARQEARLRPGEPWGRGTRPGRLPHGSLGA